MADVDDIQTALEDQLESSAGVTQVTQRGHTTQFADPLKAVEAIERLDRLKTSRGGGLGIGVVRVNGRGLQ
jgi:hypothetical protein